MTTKNAQAWRFAARQHGVVTRSQLLELGFTSAAIRRRLDNRRLHPVWRGVYAVGRPHLEPHGRWMAAVLSCGDRAVLSHGSAAALHGIRNEGPLIEVSVPPGPHPRRPGMVIHRRGRLPGGWVTRRHGIPVTTAVVTLADLARRLSQDDLEAAINQADSRGLATPDSLRSGLRRLGRQPGAGVLRKVLDRRTFVLTDSQLERLFLPLVRQAGLPVPKTRIWLNGFKVDFHWPELGLVVETDGLTYHRTPAQQNADRRRDQAHAAAGLMSLRFTHAQVKFEPQHVVATLCAVVERIHR